MAMTIDKGHDFEAALAELESVVLELEGEVKLEQALALFDRGTKLSQSCEQFLKSAEQKIEVLKRAASGAVTVEKFEQATDSKDAKEFKDTKEPGAPAAVIQTTIAGLR